jgi:hypothetical protein
MQNNTTDKSSTTDHGPRTTHILFVFFVVNRKSFWEYKPMKKNIFLLCLTTLLFIPAFAKAEANKTVEIQGVIGDSAPQSRTYEVDRKIYQFDEDITIQNESGEILGFDALKGGTEIKIIGEKIFDPKAKTKEKIKYIRIIVLK